jgi:hypothetical protein
MHIKSRTMATDLTSDLLALVEFNEEKTFYRCSHRSISDIRQTQQINIKLSFIPVIRPERYDHHRLSYLDLRFDLFSSLLAALQSCELNLVTFPFVNRHKTIYVCVCVYIV